MSSPISPSKFQGLPWESWTNALGRTSPIADKPPDPVPVDKNKGCVMKLPKEDMKTFGLCPEKDPFSVIMCETCGIYIKPQALLHHYETRHTNKPNDIQPVQPSTEVAISEKAKIKTKVKTNTKKTPTKDSKGREGIINPPPSLPISLTLETSMSEAGSSKGEGLQPIVALTPLSGASAPTAAAAVAKAPRRPPRKHAPIKEREYDPDKHCGVVTAETMKPCTWSLTCKSHPMSLRRAVTGRSKPFDQLLADHRQAKEALIQAKKKNLEQQHSTVSQTPPAAQPSAVPVPEHKPIKVEKLSVVDPVVAVIQRLPELSLDMTPKNPKYLSAAPPSLVLNGGDNKQVCAPPPSATATATASTSAQTDVVAYTLNHPRALGVSSMFSTHKIGGLVYTNRRMQIARQGLESCLQRAGNGIYMCHRGEIYSQSSSLSNVLNHMSSRAALQKKRNKTDKSVKPNKKVCLSKDSSLHDLQINNLKSVLSRQYSTPSRMVAPTTTESTFHIPNILSNALKRTPDVTSSKTLNKKPKKKNSPVMNTVLSNHSKNGMTPSKSSTPYVRAIVNGKLEGEPKSLGLGETPKFTNSNKILNEADLRKMGLRFEIFE